MSAHFHSHLCGRMVAEWLITMQKERRLKRDRADLELRFAPNIRMLPIILSAVDNYIAPFFENSGERSHLLGAVEEAVNNVLSLSMSDRLDHITVRAAAQDGVCIVEICDKGLPGEYGEELSELEKCGLVLMRHFVDEVNIYNLGLDGRCQELIKYYHCDTGESKPEPAVTENTEPASKDIEFTFRRMQKEDALKVSRGIFNEYGYTYHKDVVYYPDRLYEYVNSDHCYSVVALNNNQFAGHVAVWELEDLPGIWEWGMAVVDANYRGCGLLKKMLNQAVGYLLETGKASGMMCTAAMTHPFSQKTGISFGMTANGFVLNFLPSNVFVSTYTKHDERSSYGFFYRRLSKNAEAKKVYLHEQLHGLAASIYGEQKLNRDICTEGAASESTATSAEHSFVARWNYGSIQIKQVGTDFGRVLHEHTVALKRENTTIVQLYILIDDAGAIFAYNEAKRQGYFFTALFPDTENGDIIIMEKLFSSTIPYERNIVIPQAAELYEKIKLLDPDRIFDDAVKT